MKEIFQYTFTTFAEWKKLLIVILLVSIFTLIEAYPVISIVAFILEKMIYLSIGGFLIYLVKNTANIDEYFHNLKIQPLSSFLFHFIPTATGILLGNFIIISFWMFLFVIILNFSGSVYLLADPHSFLLNIQNASFIAQIMLGIYLIYFLFFSYIYLGKLGEALDKEDFKGAFLSILSSLIDFKFWIKTFNLKYFLIYLIWSIILSVIYSILSFAYLFYIFPTIFNNPNITLVVIPVFVGITTFLTYFTFFSSFFAYKSTMQYP
ncbi:conserved hypothetical protein [Lebetimonas natsushimae]|uniref:Uncharacterized protein n=1 Tax=Lebetimonas natsushimae TaxID=1936991 RepID=A0A292YGT5_9BACT|nr:hypothetical protein [Lebetimonas natsushimae]GAX88024.1 conserved hypothetical protein [Lebetimonas natsushimae]